MSGKSYNYDDIQPYEGRAFEEAMQRLRAYPKLLDNFMDIVSRHGRVVNTIKSVYTKARLRSLLGKVHSYEDFQKKITCDLFLELIIKSSIDRLSFDGVGNVEKDAACVFVSNHRDIVLDAALLDYVLYRNDREPCEMVIGDNLLANQFATDLFKTNGGVVLHRSLTSTNELRNETMRLSSYITHCVTEKHKSIWVAQKSGRSKDGIDNTSTAIPKMLYLASREEGLDFQTFLKKVPIVPVAISYQYDPCAVTKGRQEIKRLAAEGCYNVYKKKKYEDILDLVRGLRMYKGNVHIHIGKRLEPTYSNALDATREIDRQIHTGYRLFDSNYFAYDYVFGKSEFTDKYEDFNSKSFLKRYKGLNREVFDVVMKSYANPVVSLLNEKNM
ncbi:MAG: 1-acyl-sn-glycerol-3-phosphate acyltransferase [Sphaerochaetaceae bacterium]|nr:1-acyl-sn-glycerol-3-phosphate acyltransferase [Sphaerochaetaceae bacterium]